LWKQQKQQENNLKKVGKTGWQIGQTPIYCKYKQ
jgi:hypothetical protein